MAISAKMSFLKQLEKKLSDTVTVDGMARLLSAVADVAEGFDMQEITAEQEHDDLIECFLNAMAVQGRTQKTVEAYRGSLHRLMRDIKVTARRVTVYHLRAYISALKEKGLKDSTLEGYRQRFSSFFGWLHREGLIEKNPVINMGTIKVPKVHKQIFTDVDMEKMRQACRSIRDKAIISFLASTGCRVSELVGLDMTMIDLQNLECVVHGKGNKERTVYLDNVAAMYIRNYLATREDNEPALFVNRYGRRFATDGIREMLTRLEKVADVQHIHPHKFRRTLATNLHKRGMPIQTIAAILGHESIETSMKYIVLDNNDVKMRYRQCYAVG